MQGTVFDKKNILDTYRNLRKKIQVIKLNDPKLVDECVKIKKLGSLDIDCFTPVNNKLKAGIIGPIGMETADDDFTELLIDSGFLNSKAKRLFKGHGSNAVKTKTMIIYLEVDSLPEHVILMGERFKVTAFFEPPFQCFNCHRFGHGAKNCKNKTICVICSGNHKHTDCPNKKEFMKCSNCKGSHTSSYGGCQFMKDEREIQKLKVTNNISYRDATLKFKEKKSTALVPNSNVNNRYSLKYNNNNIPMTYPNSRNSSTIENVRRPVAKSDACVQTDEPVSSIMTQTSSVEIQAFSKEAKLASCLLEILTSMNRADTLGKKCAMISRAFNNFLGTNLTQSFLLKELKSSMNQPTPSPIVSVPLKSIAKQGNGTK